MISVGLNGVSIVLDMRPRDVALGMSRFEFWAVLRHVLISDPPAINTRRQHNPKLAIDLTHLVTVVF